MKKKIKPIEPLLKKMIELSKASLANKEELDKTREIIMDQYSTIKKVNPDKLDKLIKADSTSPEKKEKYKTLKKEYNAYKNNKELLYKIEHKNYVGINSARIKKRNKFIVFITSSAVALAIAGCAILKPKSEDKKRLTEDVTTTAYTTEEGTETVSTEKITEAETEEVDNEPRIIVGEPTKPDERRIIYGEPTKPDERRVIVGEPTEVGERRVIEGEPTKPDERRVIYGEPSNTDEPDTSENDPDEHRVIEGSTESHEPVDVAEMWTLKYIFSELKDEIVELHNSKEAEIAREKGKEYVVHAIDFIFYGADINGLKFNDLTTEFKESIYDALKGMDEIIMMYEPNYKDFLGEKYSIVKDFTKEKLGDAKELIVNKMGKEKYDSIVSKGTDIYDSIKESVTKYGGKALDYIKDKYQKWKQK